jgi:chaperonin GroEL (HSP60 family)
VEDYKEISKYEDEKLYEMVKKVKDDGENIDICKWGFDDEDKKILLKSKMNDVRWVGGKEIEMIDIEKGGRIVKRFEEM